MTLYSSGLPLDPATVVLRNFTIMKDTLSFENLRRVNEVTMTSKLVESHLTNTSDINGVNTM